MSDGGDDRVRQLEGRRRPKAPALETAQDMSCLPQGQVEADAAAERAVRGHEVATPDELIDLDEMDVAGFTGFGRMNDDEQVFRVGMELWNVPPLDHVANGKWVEPEKVGQVLRRVVPGNGDVHPDEAVVPLE